MTGADRAAIEVGTEQLLTDPDELLYRQVHPSFVVDGVPSSQAFAPTRKDEGQLSIARGSLTTAEAAYNHHTTELHLASAGTWAVTVGEASAAGLSSFDQHRDDVPAHGFIDFRALAASKARSKASLLVARARARGRLHPAAEPLTQSGHSPDTPGTGRKATASMPPTSLGR